ncbi:MAG: HAD family hydrolase [Phycisphaerae bacterium]|nr:HAD family hydrolase [Phycisphaerae bacterium]
MEHFRPAHSRLVAVDSDGCALDSMEVKQRRCFIPALIDAWGLHDVEAAVWEVAAFVNLYSRWRGANRFVALAKTFELLSRRAVREAGVTLPEMAPLRRWLAAELAPSNRTLAAVCDDGLAPVGDDCATLASVLAWSREVNCRVERLAADVSPFPAVGASLSRLAAVADVVVISATPAEALAREWSRTGLSRHVRWIAGQEAGGKASLLRGLSGRYAAGCAMMVGDAPGDWQAAREAGMLFWPICPGAEDASWRRLVPAGLERFCAGTFAGAFEASAVEEFLAGLPEAPPWGDGL